ncbi:MAG: hypothetical protein XD91_0979 [Clostridiales bacterium 38_11]|nr:MAG: hypothetical protein XD91_0979 [Clostridiales bacterium 38_11]HBH11581.1 hypothetical protein [Clostridiales bacterium]
MIRINQIKLNPNQNETSLEKIICDLLNIKAENLVSWHICKKSIDARKNEIFYVYSVNVKVKDQKKLLSKIKNKNIHEIQIPLDIQSGHYRHEKRPIIVGSGPTGIFCALTLAKSGARPLILERGKKIEDRITDVDIFWKEGLLNTESNIQFGEGGAGTFSDGKLNTLIRDKEGRGKFVLQEMVKAGAPKEILYLNKPHIGTDRLRAVIINLRNTIESYGGEFSFSDKVIQIESNQNVISSVITTKGKYYSDVVIFAIGHSARDTFHMLNQHIKIIPKPFSVGVRIEHPRKMIDFSQYGSTVDRYNLPSADYKMVHHCSNGRSVYTFCMCPGGIVTGASSEEKGIVTNGMSYYARDGENSNSAVLVSVTPNDFGLDHPLSGVAFQRSLEHKAYLVGGENYNAPVQLYKDFKNGKPSTEFGEIRPTYQPGVTLSNLHNCLPDYVVNSLIEGIEVFGRKIKGFDRGDAIITGVETRSSSPVRLQRDESSMMSNLPGLYVAGEGSGYAGGIVSSAIEGIKVAEIIIGGVGK